MSIVLPGLTVDGTIDGLAMSSRRSVEAASTENITLATDVENGDTLDGFTLSTGDRILLKNQTTASENGIYIVQATGAPIRADDLDIDSNCAGVFVVVQHGTINDDRVFLCTNDPGSDIVGTDGMTWIFLGGSGLALSGSLITVTDSTNMLTSTVSSNIWVRLDNDLDVDRIEVTAPKSSQYIISQGSTVKAQASTGFDIGTFIYNLSDLITISSLTTTNPVVITTSTSHNLRVGEQVDIFDSPVVTGGTYTVGSGNFTTTTFEVPYDNSGGATTGGGSVLAIPTTFEVASFNTGNPMQITTTLTHWFQPGDEVTVITTKTTGGGGQDVPNGTYTVQTTPTATTLTIDYNNTGGNTNDDILVAFKGYIGNAFSTSGNSARFSTFSINVEDLNENDVVYSRVRVNNTNGGSIELFANNVRITTT